MRIISLAFAAVVFFGLASSADAAKRIYGKQAHKILAEGEVLLAAERPNISPYDHSFTVRYDGQIYSCIVEFSDRSMVHCLTDEF